jgi:hypothetical protein
MKKKKSRIKSFKNWLLARDSSSIGLLTFGYGSLFKIMHWPGSGILLTAALFLFFPIAILIAVFKGFGASQNKIARILAGLGGYTLSMAILFKIMHWPNASIILTVGLLCSLVRDNIAPQALLVLPMV